MIIDGVGAPIALFVYNRKWHTQQTLESLKKNPESRNSQLFIFADGPANKSSHLTAAVDEVRDYVRTVDGFKSVKIVERAENFGLAKSITTGVSEIINEHGCVIVLEDDMVVSPFFLDFMNKGLERYAHEEVVCSINAYIYPTKFDLPQSFFLRSADCWGWATWKRAWKNYEADGQKLYDELDSKDLQKLFNFNNSCDYMGMLERQILGKNDSWAIRWYASNFLKNKLGLYPGISLVCNIGNDGSGTHCSNNDEYVVDLAKEALSVEAPLEVCQAGFDSFETFFRKGEEASQKPQENLFKKILQKIF